jgi:hypothetical protein
MRILQHYQIPLTLATFVNCYRRLNLLRLNNQALWLHNKIMMLMLAVGAMSSWTYAVMLGCSNGGRSAVDYIVGLPVVWQAATHLEVIIDDTRYRAMGGDSDHRPLRLRLNIDCSFVEP